VKRRLALLSLLACAAALRGAEPAAITAPAHNWVLPLFTPNGYRSWTLRGDEVRFTSKDRIDVTFINITVFSGDAATIPTTSVLSEQASYFPALSLASGKGRVRIIRNIDGTEASGEDWSYDFTHEKVSIHRNVEVTFQQVLKDFLK
jgi:hypothetical protein